MKLVGYILLLGGFLWLLHGAVIGFTDYQYSAWMDYSKNKLPAGDPVPRRDAIAVMRRLSLDLKDQHRLIVAPACLMLAGGFILGLHPRRYAAGDNSK